MASIIDIIADRLIGHTVNLMRFDAGLRQEVMYYLLPLQDEIAEKLLKYDPTSTRTETVGRARLRQMAADVNKTINTAYRDAEETHRRGLFGVVELEGDFNSKTVNGLIGADIFSSRMDSRVMKKLVDQTLIYGAPASEWWGRQEGNLKKRYIDQIRLGMMQNENIGDLVRRVRGTFTGKYAVTTDAKGRKQRFPHFTGGVIEMSTREAAALVRTSVQSVANAARESLYNDNLDVVKGIQALVTLDGRTSPICRGRSGFAWKLPDGEPMNDITNIQYPGPPPWHFNCRTTLIPVLRSWEELAGPKSKLSAEQLRELERGISPRMQSSMDGQVAGDLTYEGWLKTKPVEFQKEVLGPGRWALWSEGKLSLTDMIDQTGNALTLEELRTLSNLVAEGASPLVTITSVFSVAESFNPAELKPILTGGRSSKFFTLEKGGKTFFVKEPLMTSGEIESTIYDLAQKAGAGDVMIPTAFVPGTKDNALGWVVSELHPGKSGITAVEGETMYRQIRRYLEGWDAKRKTQVLVLEYLSGDTDRHAGQYLFDPATKDFRLVDFGSSLSSGAYVKPFGITQDTNFVDWVYRTADGKDAIGYGTPLDKSVVESFLKTREGWLAAAEKLGHRAVGDDMSEVQIIEKKFDRLAKLLRKPSITFKDFAQAAGYKLKY